jgi:hypothetical protein
MIRDAFLVTAAEARDLIASREVDRRWDEPSALREMTIGALAGHLARCAVVVEEYLDGPPPAPGRLLTADQYYVEGVALSDDIDDDLNRSVRDRSVAVAAAGAANLVAMVDDAVSRLHARLSAEPPDRAIAVIGGIAISLDEYLVTRLLELSVHIDDLCVSLDRPTPDLSPVAAMCALGCMLQMARARHGDLAVLRSMARRERDAVSALRVL